LPRAAIAKPDEAPPVSSYEFIARREEAEPDRIVVDLAGELDLTNAREIEERLEELSEGRDATLVLDVNRVVFIDSAALHALFRTARRLGKERFQLLFEPTAVIARTLEIVGLPEVATVALSTDENAPD
jgi:anti-anti-sigma factor